MRRRTALQGTVALFLLAHSLVLTLSQGPARALAWSSYAYETIEIETRFIYDLRSVIVGFGWRQ